MIKMDIRKYRGNIKGLCFICCYRVAHFFSTNICLRVVGLPIWVLYRFIFRWILGIDIPENVSIGRGLIVNHGVGLVVNPKAVIGNNVKLHQNTTIGSKVSGGGCPIIEDNVLIGANCVVIGPIRIGSNSIVAAGSVVVKDVPCGVIVAGNPAVVIKENL